MRSEAAVSAKRNFPERFVFDLPVDPMQARFADAMGLDHTQFERDAAITSAQRNLRILGVFARLSSAFGKPGYLALMPRVWQRLQGDLSHPDLASLRKGLNAILPEPTPGFLDTLRPGVRKCPTA